MRNDLRNRESNRNSWDDGLDFGGNKGHIWTGVFILVIGIAALIKVSNPDLPRWLFSWKTFLIALGLFIGVKHKFKGGSWAVLLLIGGAFLLADIYPDISIRRYIWPGVLIIIGAALILKPKRSFQDCYYDNSKKKDANIRDEGANILENNFDNQRDLPEDFIDNTSIFGGAKKNIISKNFKGGEIVNIFGGTDIDLSRADFNGTAVIDFTTIFGGSKLIVPSNWIVKSEAVTIFGGLEDKRNVQALSDSDQKILLLKGTIIFGGIEIKSF